MSRVLVACEFSGIVRDSFIARGIEAVSCDVLPSEREGPHLQQSVLDLDLSEYAMIIAFPPCTYLCGSGARWWMQRRQEQSAAIGFFRYLLEAPTAYVAVENPVGILSTAVRKPDQYIQPWMFGHGESKRTGLWLSNLPKLEATEVVEGRIPRVHHAAPGLERWKERSRTLPGVALAMAEQWGNILKR